MVRSIRKFSSFFSPFCMSLNGIIITVNYEIPNIIAKFFSNILGKILVLHQTYSRWKATKEPISIVFGIPAKSESYIEIKKCIHDIKPAAIDPNHFHSSLFEEIPGRIVNTLLQNFNKIWNKMNYIVHGQQFLFCSFWSPIKTLFSFESFLTYFIYFGVV